MTGLSEPPGRDMATLVDWIDGRLDDDRGAELAELVRGDERSAETVAWLRAFIEAARSLPLHRPPPIVRQHLRRAFARRRNGWIDLFEAPIELQATVLFDSRRDLALAGARGVDASDDAIHLAFTTEQADVVVDVRRLDPRTVRVDGQVLLVDQRLTPVFEVIATGPTGSSRSVDGDELSRFCFPVVTDDVTQLRITNGEIAILATVDLIDVGDPGSTAL